MFLSILYVSQSNLRPPFDKVEIENIIKFARSRNEQLDVSGTLICTAGRFAQILEGPELSVRILLRSIQADERHRGVRILLVETLTKRRFPEWRLAYQGPSIYVDRHIKPLLQDLPQSRSAETIENLIQLMVRVVNTEQPNF